VPVVPDHCRTDAIAPQDRGVFASSDAGKADAEELTNNTLLLLHSQHSHLNSPDDLYPVSVTIMKFKIRERLRQKDRSHKLPPAQARPFAEALKEQRRDDLQAEHFRAQNRN
jgi:hypothetical protein